ncbi:hypothetical protein G3A56_02360 [Rhizobium oryzihabitans]|uniref:Uncharacterized protein n=1 Tax=Rhizobium oryzihabitans TaxID=2267833 RepID=A0A7L5BCM5_9HYPH|nr:hypothetical protein [Rhizobium oryzihabitans]QIB36615.1 hypothetical protein G3A56_00190 [Rhizobium oryzihabitans]QIB36976.1 hypothetical protein G3A56_02360 [Rhizobium oryzihabitans]
MENDSFRVSCTVTAAILFFFALGIRLMFPYAEWNLDANHIMQTVIYSSLQGIPASGYSLRYWFQDNLYQWWLDAIYPVSDFARPLTATSMQKGVFVASMLPKILGALNIALIFSLSLTVSADRKISALVAAIYAITAQHLVMSTIVERQIISQSLLLISFLLVAAAPTRISVRYLTYGIAIAVNVFGVACYSPPIIFLPFLLAFIVTYEFRQQTDTNSRIKTIIALAGLYLVADLIVFLLTGASVLSVLKQAVVNFLFYANPASNDEFSKLDQSLITANALWFFGNLFQWLPYLREDNFSQISYWSFALSAVVVSYCLYCAAAAIIEFVATAAKKPSVIFTTGQTRIALFSAAFLTGIAFTLAVRHGNQTEFYIMPYTFILPVVAERLSSSLAKATVALSICAVLVAATYLNYPFFGMSMEARNSYIASNADTILPTMILKPEL